MKAIAYLFAVAVLTLASVPADAQDSRLRAFFGTYAGSAVAENRDSEYFGVTVRDLDFTIESHGEGGFKITWTTVKRESGTPQNPETERETAGLSFMPAEGRKGVYRATTGGDPLKEPYYAWARIERQTLSIYVMSIGDDGTYQVAEWDRTLVAGGMEITFTRVRDGDKVRTVTGKGLRER